MPVGPHVLRHGAHTGAGPLRVHDIERLSALLEWLESYVSRPHERLGRSGIVCPFVPISMRTDAMEFVVHRGVTGADRAELARVIEAHAAEFASSAAGTASERRRRSLLLVFPSMTGEHLKSLDTVHTDLKTAMVRNGLMFGQFHSRCPDGAVRNPDFKVSLSPVPCVAIRYMAPHDILFLHDRPEWFGEYRRRFGGDYRRGKVKDPHMIELFRKAESSEEAR